MQCIDSNSTKDTTAPREVAPFLKSLRRMLQDESDAVLRWTPDGRAFEIHDMHEMMAHVLPKYFKHCKYTSFQRQLNYFSFRKWTKSKAVVCTFSNDFFLRDQPELAWRITRKKSLSPHALPRYRPASTTRTSVLPYWKKESNVVLSAPYPVSFESMLLPSDRSRLPYSTDADLMLKQHDVRHAQQTHPSRRYFGFNMAPPSEPCATRTYDLANGNDGIEQTEPFDWIDCLLPPTDDSYMCMYPPAAAVAPYTVNTVNMRKSFEFVPSTL
ncbi:HSF-type DNA-binding protein [Phytophthora palmivora]|uniref:HSF-type DNA-binding protein n=1 Tax=Phytophthora palmivora TaxID=4796 RepID=A0A2P4Y4S1_9STRA|nr:HSF-type DNA-binding protein [Phytophthora palmivora]